MSAVIPLTIIIFVGCAIFGSVIGHKLILPLFGGKALVNDSVYISGLVFTISELLSYVLAISLIFLWVKHYEEREFTSIGLPAVGATKGIFIGALIGLAAFSLWVIGAYSFGAVMLEDAPSQLIGVSAIGGVLLASVGVLIAAVAEEVIFRGWALSTLSIRYSPIIGIIVTATVFGLPHGLNDDINAIGLVNVGLGGIMLALWALNDGNLWRVIGFHWLWNLSQFNLYGFDLTSDETLGGALVNLQYTDRVPFITNGLVAEDGLVITLALVIAILGLIRSLKNKDFNFS